MEKTCSKRPTSIVHRSHEATNRTGLAVPCLTWRSYVPQQTHEHSQHPGTPPHAGARTTTGRDVSAFRCPGWPTLRQLGPGHVGRNPIYQEILRCHQEMVDVDWKLLILDSTFWVAEAWERIVCHSAFNLKCWQIVCEKSPNPDVVGVQIHPKPPHREQSLLLDSTYLQASAHSKSWNQMLRCDWHIQTDLTTIYMWQAYIFLEHDSLAHMFFPSAVGRCQKAPGA